MFIRYSIENDKDRISTLLKICFGYKEHCGVLENLNGRYLLAFNNEEELIAMTGIIWCEEYKALEIDWTCTHPDFRNMGIMHELFKRICSTTDQDIYCSCWRLAGKEHVNLNCLMKDFGFKEVIRNRVTWDSRYNCKTSSVCGCTGRNLEDSALCLPCRCYEDLYLREAVKICE